VEVVAEVTAPANDIGPMPLVLFLHGRHSTCYLGGPDGEESGDWPCPDGWRPVPSYTGYRYIADVLASQGYLTVSIAANWHQRPGRAVRRRWRVRALGAGAASPRALGAVVERRR
jgi:hypothetical protein